MLQVPLFGGKGKGNPSFSFAQPAPGADLAPPEGATGGANCAGGGGESELEAPKLPELQRQSKTSGR